MFPCNCHPPFPRPEPFSPLPRPGKSPDWGKWIRDRLAEKGALLAFPTRTAFPSAGDAPSLYLAEDTGVVYRWGGEGYAVLVDPSSDVETYSGRSAFPDAGRAGVIYVDASANLLYRWDETGYVLLTTDLSGVESRLADVESKVPAQATAQNQLADKAFVNSSIATNTAFYITDNGRPFQSLADLESYEGALTNNDYAFVVGRDAVGNTTYTRYKWNEATEAWGEEYVLNNSSFTAEQWAAISSGITSGLVAKLGALPTAEALAASLAGKQDKLFVLGDWSVSRGEGGTEIDELLQAGITVTISRRTASSYLYRIEGYDESAYVVYSAMGRNGDATQTTFPVYDATGSEKLGTVVAVRSPVDIPAQVDTTPNIGSGRLATSGGIWSMIWGALSALPSGVSSLYDWVVAQLAGKLDGVVSVTHAELVAMRNAGQLKPGQQYRITDYVATTNGSSDSQSAGHPFDIVVTADDERTLNEHARATMHDGDLPDDIVDGTTRRRYFAGNDLAAWDVWYCIDNDDERFGWADTTNGKGVIYRLVDEFDNDVPYDFKGLQMKPLLDPFGEGVGSYDTQYRYTFDMDGYDASLNLPDSGVDVARNRIGPNGDAMAEPRQLNRVIFLGGDTISNTLAGDCSEITIKEGHDNEFGHNCRYIFLGSWSSGNVFAPQCAYIKLGEACYSNMFGAGSMDSSFGNDCQSNVLGPYSVAEFDSYCSGNFVAGNSQGAVVLGGECRGNYVGWENGRIECGRGCYNNTFGAVCGEIYVGDGVLNCSFGSGCWVVYFKAPEGQIQGYFSNITFEEGLHMIYLFCSVDHGDEVPCANITVSKGVDGTALGDMIRIEVDDAGQNYKTTYKPAGSKEISVEVYT